MAPEPTRTIHQEPATSGKARVPYGERMTLKIGVGQQGQTGGSKVVLNGKVLYEGIDPADVPLGLIDDLDGASVHITTTVTDLSNTHNNINRKLEVVSGTPAVQRYLDERTKTVPNNGDSVVYDDFISLVAVLP
ncbi:MAG: hypothetical protein ABI432_01135 [Flavobacteriales bacterium]